MFKHNKTFVIAEIGYNHGGSLEKAKRLVNECAAIENVDAIKFQIDSPHKIYSSIHGKQGFDFFKDIQLSPDEYIELFHYIKNTGKVSFLSISDDDLIEIYVREGLELMKISSSSFCNYRILDPVFRSKIPTIASVGVSDYKEMIEIYNEFKNNNTPLSLMYCVSLYPTPLEKVSINNIGKIKQLFPDLKIGYSDHTAKQEVAISAVAKGAELIEVHVMLDNDDSAVEKDVSYSISQFRNLNNAIRNAEVILNDSNDDRVSLNPEISKSRSELFRSLYLDKDIEPGDVITLDKVAFKRPGIGIASNYWKLVEGRVAAVSKPKDEPLNWEDLK